MLDAVAKRLSVGRTEDQIRSDYEAVAISPYETLGAPRVGADESASEWARAQYEKLETKRYSIEEHLNRLSGYWVLDLLPPNDGLPIYSNGTLYEGVDRFSFRGQFLIDCKSILGERLLNEAWEPHESEALMDFGHRLKQCANRNASSTGTTHWLTQRDPPDGEEGPAHQTHVIISAASWCLFWAERGHGLEPYF